MCGLDWAEISSGIKLDHRPFNLLWARWQPEILDLVPVGFLD